MQPDADALKSPTTPMKPVDEERPMFYEEREEQRRQAQAKLLGHNLRPDMYEVPSSAGTSEYSRSVYSQEESPKIKSHEDENSSMETASIARKGVARTISVRT